jgi:hypothetical protein
MWWINSIPLGTPFHSYHRCTSAAQWAAACCPCRALPLILHGCSSLKHSFDPALPFDSVLMSRSSKVRSLDPVEVALFVDLCILSIIIVVAPLLEQLIQVSVMNALHRLNRWIVHVRVGLEEQRSFAVAGARAFPKVTSTQHCLALDAVGSSKCSRGLTRTKHRDGKWRVAHCFCIVMIGKVQTNR